SSRTPSSAKVCWVAFMRVERGLSIVIPHGVHARTSLTNTAETLLHPQSEPIRIGTPPHEAGQPRARTLPGANGTTPDPMIAGRTLPAGPRAAGGLQLGHELDATSGGPGTDRTSPIRRCARRPSRRHRAFRPAGLR